MSQENVKIVRQAMAAFNRSKVLVGGREQLPWLRRFCDPALVLDLSRREIDPGIYHGYDGFFRLGRQDGEVWQEASFEPEEIIDAGDSIALFTRNTGLSRSGIKLDVRVGHVLILAAGKIVRWTYFGDDRAACLEAAGLKE